MMKQNKKLLAMLLAATATFALSGCFNLGGSDSSSSSSTADNSDSSISSVVEDKLTLSQTTLALAKDATATLTATLTVNGESADASNVVWSTSNSAVATVAGGVVTAVGEGTATITATVGELTATCAVTVAAPVELTLSSEFLADGELYLFEGETDTLTVTASDGNEYDYVWESSDDDVATVVDGVVTAVGEGTATITATVGVSSVSCTVTVFKEAVTMSLSQSQADMKVGDTLQINATLSDGSTPEIAWTTSVDGVVTVVNGLVTAVAEGSTRITATAGEASAYCDVTVSANYELIFTEITSEEDFYVGDTVTLNIVAKANGVEQGLEYVDIEGNGCTIDGNVATLTKGGAITITASYAGQTQTRTIYCYQKISTNAEFLAIGENLSGWYKLTADLDFAGAKITAFSSSDAYAVDNSVAFTGIFDGQGHSISNFQTHYNQTWNSSDRNRSIFGYMRDGAVIKNVSFLNVLTADRTSIVASGVEANAGCLIENVYIEAAYQDHATNNYGANLQEKNPGGFLVGNLYAGNTVKNCVVVMEIAAGTFITYNDVVDKTFDGVTTGANKAAWQGAFAGINDGTIENCHVVYKPEEGQALNFKYTGAGTETNCGVYATVADLWANADLSSLQSSDMWTAVENSIPHVGYMGAEVTLSETAAEVPAGGSYQINATCDKPVVYVSNLAGVTVDANGLVSVAETLTAGDKAVVKVYCAYDASKYAEVEITVGDKVEATASVTEITVDNVVVGVDAAASVDFTATVKVNGEAVDTYTVESSNTNVFVFEEGKVVVKGNGSAKVLVKMGGATVLEVPVTVTNAYYPVYTTAEFLAIGTSNDTMSKYYKLMNNLDFEGATINAFSSYWAYTNHSLTYTGVFDGNGYTISNMVIKPNTLKSDDADAAIFGRMSGNAAVRNLSIIGAKISERSGVIANMMLDNAVVENIYVEAEYTKTMGLANANNPAGGIVAKMSSASTVLRNSIIVLTVSEGVVPTATHGLVASFVVAGATINNCQAIYAGSDITALVGTDKGATVTNSAKYASLADFYANADLTKYDANWNLVEGQMPYYGKKLTADITVAENAVEIPVGTSKNVTVNSALAYVATSDTAGVTFENGVISVADTVAAGTTATITFTCAYDKAETATITVSVVAAVEATSTVESITEDIVLGEAAETVDLGVVVTKQGAAVSEGYEIKSSNAEVVTVENGVATLVGGGSANITVEMEGAVLLTIPVNVTAYNAVRTTADFLAIGTDATTMAKNYMLMNDLDFGGASIKAFSSYKSQACIQGTSITWQGIFDGNGHSISNFKTAYNTWAGYTPKSGQTINNDRDRGIFGYLQTGSVVRNVAFLNVTTCDRMGVVANITNGGSLIENVYIEANIIYEGANTNSAANPGGIIAQKPSGTIRNCLVHIKSIQEGFTATYLTNPPEAGKEAYYKTCYDNLSMGVGGINDANAVIDNCQVIYSGLAGEILPLYVAATSKATPTNSAIYTSLDAFYNAETGADLTKYTNSNWHFAAGYMPYFGNMKPSAEDYVITGENEVYQGNSVTLTPPAYSTLSLKEEYDGVTINGNTVTVAADCALESFTVVASSVYWADTCEFTVAIKANAFALEMAKTEYSFTWVDDESEDVANYSEALVYNVTLNGEAYEGEVTFESANEAVAVVENNVVKAVGDGSTTITMKAGDVVLGEISVTSTMYTAVKTVENLNAINSNLGGKYRLMNDITINGNFNTIGCWHSGKQFTGIFDGNNHAIKNFVPVYDGAVNSNCGLFGTINTVAVVRNLSVIGATLNGRISGGIAVQNNGLIENCYAEVTINYAAKGDVNNPMGGAVSKQYGTMRNVITMVTLGDAVTEADLVSVGGLFGRSYAASVVENCYSISPATISAWESGTPTLDPKVANSGTLTNVVDFDSLDAFYAAEGGANTSVFSNAWNFVAGQYPYLGEQTPEITVGAESVDCYVGLTTSVTVNSTHTYFVSSDTAGVTFADGVISVADTVAAETVATITLTSAYDKTVTASVTVTVKAIEINATAAVSSITNDKAIIGVTEAVDLGVQVTINGEASNAYEVASDNTAVATVADGKVTIVGSGSANVNVSFEGSTILTVPVSAVAYNPIYDAEDFENCGNTAAARKLNYILMNDIDFKDESGNPTEFHAFTCWNSAFNASTKETTGWAGIFDGNGYALKNIIPSLDNRNTQTGNDASIFGSIAKGGVIRNLKVYARATYRGGVIASLIEGDGKIENCYVEVTVASTLTGLSSSNTFGGIIFRSQAHGILQNNICIMTLEKNAEGATINTSYASGIVHVNYGKSYNNFSIIASGETMKVLTTTNNTTVNTNNASFTSYDAFFAAEGGADYSSYTSVWSFDAENKTIGLKAGCSYKAN